jgi:hypothetical protein
MKPLVLAALALSAVPAAAASNVSAGTFARLGQTVRLPSLRVTPIAVVEDSRCPRLVTCVWRGRLRITAAINGQRMTLDNGVPIKVARGRLTLVGADPISQRGERIAPTAYRFELRFER